MNKRISVIRVCQVCEWPTNNERIVDGVDYPKQHRHKGKLCDGFNLPLQRVKITEEPITFEEALAIYRERAQ